MFIHSFTLFAILALGQVALATNPACLIDAVGAQPNPADFKALCGTFEHQVMSNLTQKCSGPDRSSAISIYSASCLSQASMTIVTSSSMSTTGTTQTTPTVQATPHSSNSATSSTTVSSAPTPTSTSGTSHNLPFTEFALFVGGTLSLFML